MLLLLPCYYIIAHNYYCTGVILCIIVHNCSALAHSRQREAVRPVIGPYCPNSPTFTPGRTDLPIQMPSPDADDDVDVDGGDDDDDDDNDDPVL